MALHDVSGVIDVSSRDDVGLVANFVRRLRRIALHPLVRDDQGELVRELMSVPITFNVKPEGVSDLKYGLVDEVMFESLAVRIRPLTLNDDPVSFFAALKALDRVTNCRNDVALRLTSKALRTEWRECTDVKEARAYYVQTETGIYTDIQLAFAWLYQDSVHGEVSSTGDLDVTERFRAAVGVFSHLAVLALEMLHYMNALVEMGVVELPVGTFFEPVVVTDANTEYREVKIYTSDVEVDIAEWNDLNSLPQGFRPIHEVLAEEEGAERGDQ